MALENRPEDRQLDGAGKKKPFEPPRLYVYGDITTVTRNVAKNVNPDGAAHGSTFSQ